MNAPSKTHPSPLSGIEKLSETHELDQFDCGDPSIDNWLQYHALTNQRSDSTQTFVTHRNNLVVGFYSLCAGSVTREESPLRIAKGLAKYPIGVILLARLAVHKTEQGTGLGKALLKDALIRTESVTNIIGARAVLVHAANEKAKEFYRKFRFEPSPLDPLQMMLIMKDIRKQLKETS